MVTADSQTKANHHFKFRALGAVTTQFHGSFVARIIPEWNRLRAAAADAVSPTYIVPLEIERTTGQFLAVWSVGGAVHVYPLRDTQFAIIRQPAKGGSAEYKTRQDKIYGLRAFLYAHLIVLTCPSIRPLY